VIFTAQGEEWGKPALSDGHPREEGERLCADNNIAILPHPPGRKMVNTTAAGHRQRKLGNVKFLFREVRGKLGRHLGGMSKEAMSRLFGG